MDKEREGCGVHMHKSNEMSKTARKYKKCACLFVCPCQDPKLREVLGFGKGDNVEGKLVTVVHGNDLVNTSFLNFQAMQEDTAKVTMETTTIP